MTKTDIEALMRPRYKVIADYPGIDRDNWAVGDVIDAYAMKFAYPQDVINYMSKYPHLFKPLAWYEEREASEMPEYLKAESGNIFKVQKWESDSVFFTNGEHWYITPNVFCFFLPATHEDYLQYINNQNKK